MSNNFTGNNSGKFTGHSSGSKLLSAIHYATALGLVLVFADILTSNTLHLSATADFVRQLSEFSNIPSNYKIISVDTIRSSAENLSQFMHGNSLISHTAILMLLGLNVALIVLHFLSHRLRRQQPATNRMGPEQSIQNERGSVGSFGHVKALVQNLKSMITGSSIGKGGHGLNSSAVERIVHLNLDIETAANIVKDLESNLAQSATELQVLAKSAMESGNRAVSTTIEWNKQTKMLEKQNHLNQNVQFILKGMKRTIKDVTQTAQETKQTEHALVSRSKAIEVSVRELYERSEEGDQLVQDMHTNIDTCISDVRTASDLVKQLSGKAREIVNIISVIDDIAEQTNLLALNASIEAARAGEQGQGFAVVADEVRKLAVRSSSTTRNITHLLQTIQTEAESACGFLGKGENSITHTSSLFGRFGQHVASDRSTISRCLEDVGHTHQSIRKLSADFNSLAKSCTAIEDLASNLSKVQSDIMSQNDTWLTEIRNSSIATDRIARNLTRNHFKLEHLERLAISNVDIARDVHKLVSQNIGFSGIIRGTISNNKNGQNGSDELGQVVRYVEMLESAVSKLDAQSANSGGNLRKEHVKQEPSVGQMATEMHPYEKTVFSDLIESNDERGSNTSKGA